MFKKTILYFLVFLSAIMPGLAFGGENIRVFVPEQGDAPLFIKNKRGMSGLIPEILSDIKDYNFSFIVMPENQRDIALLTEQVDVALMHPLQTDVARLVNFVPIGLFQEDRFFTTKENPFDYENLNDIRNASICMRNDVEYANLKDIWYRQKLVRLQSVNYASMLQLLTANRCHYAVGSHLNIIYEAKKMGLKELVQTDIIVTRLPRYFAVLKNQQELQKHLYEHLEPLLLSGWLAEQLKEYETLD